MSGRRGRIARANVAIVGAAVVVSACGAERHAVAFCDGPVHRVEVFNVYGDHEQADRQVVEDPDTIDFNCTYMWRYDDLRSRAFTDDELFERTSTVLVLHHEGETTRVVRAHQLAGVHAGTAILTDDGGSFFLPNDGLPHYYQADAEPLDRAAIPVSAVASNERSG